jgi:foldase protein PrsA
MSERNEKENLNNETIENEIENEQIDSELIEDEIENDNEADEQEQQELLVNKSANEQGEPAAPTNSSAIIVPWVVAAIAIIALVFVLFFKPSGDDLNKTVGSMDGATYKTIDLYNEMSKQMGEDQQGSMLDNLMTLKLIELEASKAGVVVSETEIQTEIDNIKKSNNFATDADFEAALKQSNLTLESFKEQISTQMKLRKIFEKNSPASEDDLKAYYDSNIDTFATTPHQVKASHILLTTKEEAEAVLAELKAGKDFATLAKEKSTDTGSAENGGDLGFFGKGKMNEGFETAAFALKKGEMSGVVEAESGFHIIKVTDIKEAVVPAYDKIKDNVRQTYFDEKIKADGQAWMEKVKKERNYKNLLVKEPDPAATATASPAAAQ